MERLIERLQPLNEFLGRIQNVLDFDGWELHSQFATSRGLGRVALICCMLSIVWGVHATVLAGAIFETMGIMSCGLVQGIRLQMISRWCFYICSMSSFHLLEFFTTAVYNPGVTSSESYLVNHSKAYTAAFLFAFLEFWIRFLYFPGASTLGFVFGAVLVLFAQSIRTWAMITCGESFNHLIQTCKKENHILVTDGVYKYLRHPSYVGFYYWSIATQLVLNNWFSTILFAAASLMFFRRRIPYEEESLLEHFPDEYEAYASTTYVGIPFIPSLIPLSKSPKGDEKTD